MLYIAGTKVLSTKLDSEGLKKATTRSKSQDFQGHLTYGVIHSNGFMHPLWINGFEGGYNFVT